METKAFKKRCKTVGCPNLHSNRSGYCNACSRSYYAAHQSSYEERRASSTERGYDARWNRFARDFLKSHPTCTMCGKPSTCVDHKDMPADVMLSAYGRFDLDPIHYQALCNRCNASKGKREDRMMRNEYEKDMKWIERHGGGKDGIDG